ncbi:MAG TPA: J domain-containing protein [Vicinamibacteria bacterium]|nr:J domain-containing protein [Vicinamibacteria bacterium]
MDLYERLGARRGASQSEIRRAWQRLARALHPAVNPGDPASAQRYREAAQAFEVLSDPQRRAAYDRGEQPAAAVEATPEGGFEGFDFSARVRIETMGFREIFDAARPAGDGSRGEDLEQATRVTFEESMAGTTRRVHLVRFEPCPSCQGAGELAFGPLPCPRCQGRGTLRGSRGHMIFSRPCADCGGTGEIRRRCDRCGGEGRGIASEWLEVRIPPGVGSGSQVRLPGAGNAGRRGGPPGDFVLTVEVEEHPVFRREGDDLHCVVQVGMVVAALGGHVEVATPDGPVTIEVPAGTQTGQRFRLRKRGVPRPGDGGRGDLWVEAAVVIPAATDDRARALLRELAEVLPRS